MGSPERAVEKLDWYARRWQIEMFHHILKTGCRAEHPRLRTAERLVKLIAAYGILAWRVFWTTMIGRSAPRADPHLAVTDQEIALLDRLVPDWPAGERSLFAYVVKVARVGPYLARSRHPPPGNLVTIAGLCTAHRHRARSRPRLDIARMWVKGSVTEGLPERDAISLRSRIRHPTRKTPPAAPSGVFRVVWLRGQDLNL